MTSNHGDSPARWGVSEQFRAAAADPSITAGPVELLPTRLAQLCCPVLDVDGAGLSVFSDDFRVPLGASDEQAAAVERLQFTAQEGPCWDAVHRDLPLAVDAGALADRWPQFHADMRRHTSYRSVVSVPLRLSRSTGGALDLYFRDRNGAGRFDTGDATAVTAHIAEILNTATDPAPPHDDDDPAPPWLRGPTARARTAVWIAVGMLISQGTATAADALALLRAAAYSEERSLDELADDLLQGRRHPDQLHGDTDPAGPSAR